MKRIENVGDLRAFEAVARLGSLSAAARDLGVPLSVLSKRLARLERILGTRLAERSTRMLRVTAAGEGFLSPCRDALRAFDALEDRDDTSFRGRVRISSSVALARRRIAPCLPELQDRYPDVTIEMLATDRLIDLVREGVDVAFRQMNTARGNPGELIAADGHVLVASQQYVDRHGTPDCPEDLAHHRCLTVGQPAPRSWKLCDGRKEIEVPIHPAISGTDGEPAHAAALAGGGIAMKSKWDVLEDLAERKLIHVLPGWGTGEREIRAILPAPDHRPRVVIHLIDHVRRHLARLETQFA